MSSSHGPHRIITATCSLIVPLLGLALLVQPCFAQKNKPVPEYVVKSALLAKFIKFVEWPDSSFQENKFCILIVGKNPMDNVLNDLQGKVFKGHQVEIRRVAEFSNDMEIGTCHMLFIDREQKRATSALLEATKGRPILTVGEFDGFVKEQNGMINMVLEDNKIRLQINQREASEQGLRIPSALLRSAIFVIRKNTE